MRHRIVLFTLVAGLVLGCNDHEVQSQEVAATVLNPDYAMCLCCGGTFVQIDSVRYRAIISDEYKSSTKVWLRFEISKNSCGRAGNLIDVLSIRRR